jgi:hypothetical protein
MVNNKGKSKMPSASFTTSRSYVRRSRRKVVNRISHVAISSSGKLTSFSVFGLVLGPLLLTAYCYVGCNEKCIFQQHFSCKVLSELTIYAFKGEETIR